MLEKHIRFGRFSIPRLNGLKYLQNEETSETDYLFVNEPRGEFSMYFEKNFPRFSVPDQSDRDYCLFQIKRTNKTIHLFCPERHRRLRSVVWYFSVELFGEDGERYCLPGQVRVNTESRKAQEIKHQTTLLSILEQIQLHQEPIASQGLRV